MDLKSFLMTCKISPNDQESIRTTTVTLTQGIADKLSKQLDDLLNVTDGAFKKERDSLADVKQNKTKEMDKLEESLSKKARN